MEKKIYEGKVLGLSIHNITVNDRKVKREIIKHNGAAAILAFDENNKVILVKQYRYPHGDVLEIPAGTLEKNEEPIKCAFREFEEETGYKAKKMTRLISYYPSIGYNTEIIHCFLASGVEKTGKMNLDDDEILKVVKMDIKKIQAMINNGKIQDSKTICAILSFAARA